MKLVNIDEQTHMMAVALKEATDRPITKIVKRAIQEAYDKMMAEKAARAAAENNGAYNIPE